MEATLDNNPLLKDLVGHYKIPRNIKNRLEIAEDFAVGGMDNRDGLMFASGSITLGGAFAPVDSFLGLQYAAQQSVDTLAKIKAPGVHKFGTLRSIGQWLRWVRGVAP